MTDATATREYLRALGTGLQDASWRRLPRVRFFASSAGFTGCPIRMVGIP